MRRCVRGSLRPRDRPCKNRSVHLTVRPSLHLHLNDWNVYRDLTHLVIRGRLIVEKEASIRNIYHQTRIANTKLTNSKYQIQRNPAVAHFKGPDALLPIYRIKRKIIKISKIYIVISGISLLADALLRGSSVHSLYIVGNIWRLQQRRQIVLFQTGDRSRSRHLWRIWSSQR